MSNPDLPGPYWQDQDGAGYGSRRRARATPPSPQQSAWDDGGGYWRDDRRGAQHQGSRAPGRGSRRADAAATGAGDGSWANVLAGRSRREARSDKDWGSSLNSGRSASRAGRSAHSERGDWTGRLSQTADDLRSRLGIGSRSGTSRDGDRAQGRWRDAAKNGFGRVAGPGRGQRRSAQADYYGPGDYGDGSYGDGGYGDDGYGGGGYGAKPAGGRTAVRHSADDFWGEPDRTRGGNGHGGGGYGGGRWNGGGQRRGGGGFKNWLLYGSWWRHWTLKKALAVVGGGIAACFLLGIAVFFILYKMTPIPTASELTANWQSSSVYFADGKQMGTYDTSVNGVTIDRMLLTSQQIPPVMTQAMAAAEDRHFYTEGGVSVTGLMRAAYEDVFGNGNLQGGSTITMQYAKNYYNGVNGGQNLSTKLKEIFIAMKLGHEKSKSWVMTNYLNTVPFGPTIDGLGAAAENYFNINLTQPGEKLTLAQAAMLAAMPNSPSVFNPDPHAGTGYQLLVARWHYVLEGMVKDGDIPQSVADAQKFPKLNPPPAGNGQSGYTGYLMNMVEQQLEAPTAVGGYGLTQKQIDTGGYKIRTTFSMARVKALARSVNAEKAQMRALGAPFRSYDRIGAALENSKTGAIVAIYGGPGYLANQKRCAAASCYINMAESAQQVGSSFKPYVLAAAVKDGMNVFTSKLNGFSPIWIPTHTPNGATATQLMLSRLSQPPGCSRTARNCFSSDGNTYFKFDESAENSGKPLPVNVAAAISSDPAFEDLVHREGIDNTINMAQQLGVGQSAFVAPCGATTGGATRAQTIQLCNDLTGPSYVVGKSRYQGHGLKINFSPNTTDKYARNYAGTPGSPAIALGENPLTPIEQATAFATLADDGLYHTPHVIQSVQQNGVRLASHLITQQVLTPQQAADVDYALSFDNNYAQGTAEANVPYRRGYVIGKTGTLGTGANASQAWFIGATPDGYAMSVALFTNEPGIQNLNNLPSIGGTPGSQGGGWPASIWNNFMTAEFSNAPYTPLFQQDQGAPFVAWIQVHGKPKNQGCNQGGGNDQGGGKKGCFCPPGAQQCIQPNPQPSCHGNGHCSGGGPSPTPTCQGVVGLLCGSPTPSVTPSGTPSVSPNPTCTAPPGQCGHTAQTASYVLNSAGSGSQPGSAASNVLLAAEDPAIRLAALLGLVI